jgi:hypothetical protein
MFGDVETYLTKTVPQYMQKSFNAATATGSIAIAGLSEGGLCATTLALNNSKEYVAFGNYSGDASPTYQYDNEQQTIQTLFGGSKADYDAHNPPSLLTGGFAGLSGWFRPSPDSRRCRPPTGCAAAASVGSALHRHAARRPRFLWQQAYSDSLPWLSWKLKLTPQPSPFLPSAPPGRASGPAMTAAILFAVLSACKCSAVLQRLAVSAAWPRRSRPGGPHRPVPADGALGGLPWWARSGSGPRAVLRPAAVVQPILVLELIFTLGFRAFLLHDDVAARTWSAALDLRGLAAFLWPLHRGHPVPTPGSGSWPSLRAPDRGGAAPAQPARLAAPPRRHLRRGHGRRVVGGRRVSQADGGRASPQRRARAAHPLAALRHDRDRSAGTVLLQGSYAVGRWPRRRRHAHRGSPRASSGHRLFGEQLRSPGYVLGAVLSCRAGAGIVMLSSGRPR